MPKKASKPKEVAPPAKIEKTDPITELYRRAIRDVLNLKGIERHAFFVEPAHTEGHEPTDEQRWCFVGYWFDSIRVMLDHYDETTRLFRGLRQLPIVEQLTFEIMAELKRYSFLNDATDEFDKARRHFRDLLEVLEVAMRSKTEESYSRLIEHSRRIRFQFDYSSDEKLESLAQSLTVEFALVEKHRRENPIMESKSSEDETYANLKEKYLELRPNGYSWREIAERYVDDHYGFGVQNRAELIEGVKSHLKYQVNTKKAWPAKKPPN
jgi:hypothetical protein